MHWQLCSANLVEFLKCPFLLPGVLLGLRIVVLVPHYIVLFQFLLPFNYCKVFNYRNIFMESIHNNIHPTLGTYIYNVTQSCGRSVPHTQLELGFFQRVFQVLGPSACFILAHSKL